MSDCCSGSKRMIYACSGGSNTGQITNEMAKNLSSQGYGSMTCGIGMGADLSGFIVSAGEADKNIVLDGCSVSCLKKVFDRHKIKDFDHYILTDMGIKKDKNLSPDAGLVLKMVREVIRKSCLEADKDSGDPGNSGACCKGGNS